jgi:Na+/melibiose symporter and related transporters
MTMTNPATRPRLGAAFGRLWSASIASNLADGLGRTAIPLIATTLTRDPLLIAGVTAASFLPWLLFGLPAGLLLDRVDRRMAMAVANGLRVLMALVVALAVTTGLLTIWLLYACILIWGMGETVFDTGTNAVLPSTVPHAGLEKANGRIQAAQLVVDTFIGTPISGLKFAAAIALPVWSTAAGFAVSGMLALLLPATVARAAGAATGSAAHRGARRVAHEAGEALAFIWRHRLLRALLILTTLAGGALSFGQASEVLYFLRTMSVPPALLGVMMAITGAGALLGSLSASALVRVAGRGRVMAGATLLGGIGLMLVGFAPGLVAALISYAVSAFAISVWNVPWASLRQELIPGELLGRTIGFIRSMSWGIIPLATVLGGAVARVDLRLPFIIGGAGVAVVVLFGWRVLLSVDAAAEPAQSSSNSSGTAPD